MRFKIPGLRRAGVAAVAALTAGTAFATLAPTAAFAATTGTLNAVTQPTIVAASTNQTAGNWSIPDLTTTAIGDKVTINVDDSNAGNCVANGDTLGFHASPTLTVTDNVAGHTAPTLSVTTQADPTNVACVTLAVKNQLVITTTALGSNPADTYTVTISGVAYDVGNTVATGPITVTPVGVAAGVGAFTDVNATIIAVVVSSNVPPTAILPASAGQPISNVVLTEKETGALATGTFVCVAIQTPAQPTGPSFTASSTPSVGAAGGSALVNNANGGPNGASAPVTFGAAGPTIPSSTPPFLFLGFQVAQASTSAPAVFTISGLKLDSGSAVGPVIAGVGTAAGASTITAACGNAAGATPTLGTTELTAIVAALRVFGNDRYGTAAAVFNGFACPASKVAVLATGVNFPDALAASYEAGARRTGILLTDPNAVPAVTLSSLRQSGVTDIAIIGGPAAISTAVEDQLKATPAYVCGGGAQAVDANGNPLFLKITRLFGATRYDTAQAVAQDPSPAKIGTADVDGDNVSNPQKTAILASGANFPDAIAGGVMAYAGDNACHLGDDAGGTDPFFGGGFGLSVGTGSVCGAAANGFPLVLTDPASLSPQAQAALLNDGITQVIVLGGTAAVSANVATQLTGLGLVVIRLGGANRMETATKIAAFETGTYGDLPPDNGGGAADDTCGAFVAPATSSCTKPVGLFYATNQADISRGDNFPDALAGAAQAGALDVAATPHTGFDCVNEAFADAAPSFVVAFGAECGIGPSPILLTQDPATLSTELGTYLSANNSPHVDDSNPHDLGGIVLLRVLGGTVAVANATVAAALNNLT